MSPINNDIERIMDRKKLKFNINSNNVDKTKDIEVPDQVLFGLIFGKIKGPAKYRPVIKAIVSLKKEIKNIK